MVGRQTSVDSRQRLVDLLGSAASYNDKGHAWTGNKPADSERLRVEWQAELLAILRQLQHLDPPRTLVAAIESGAAVRDDMGSYVEEARQWNIALGAALEDITAMESTAFASWPAIDGEEDFLGWRLRYCGGHTKRANSANSTAGAVALSDEQIEEAETRYRRRGLSPIFRLVSAMAPPGMDAELEQRGYQYVDRSLVMSLPLVSTHAGKPPALIDDPAEWLTCYAEASGAAVSRQEVHLSMLRAISGQCAFAVERRDGRAACVALGVLVEGRLGLFDVATSAQSRRQGLARGLCSQLLAWGLERGAHTAYLQVVAANAPAVRLYEGMGFREAYHYWYRVAA